MERDERDTTIAAGGGCPTSRCNGPVGSPCSLPGRQACAFAAHAKGEPAI